MGTNTSTSSSTSDPAAAVDTALLRAWGPLVRRGAGLLLAALLGAGTMSAVEPGTGAAELVIEVRELKELTISLDKRLAVTEVKLQRVQEDVAALRAATLRGPSTSP